MGEQVHTQMDMLEKCLECKKNLLMQLLEQTREQEAVLNTEPFSEQAFEAIMASKAEMLDLLQKYDQGFETTFGKIKATVIADKEAYRAQVERMQRLISEVTDIGVKIQALEQQNKRKLELYLSSKKGQIKNFNVNNRTVANYYKTMSAASRGEAYFMDKKS